MNGSSRFPNNPDLPVGAIIAGGEGRRLGQGEKPLVMLSGLPLVGHAINALTPQVRGLVLNLRAPQAWAEDFKLPVIIDDVTDAGPAGGIAATLGHLRPHCDFVVTAPADCPFLPADLVSRLSSQISATTDLVVAASGGQRHHLIALWRTALAPEITAHVTNGVKAIHDLQSRFRTIEAQWPVTPYDPFFNINTPSDLTTAEAICSAQRGSIEGARP